MRFLWPFYDFIVYGSLDVRHVQLDFLFFNFMFSYLNVIIYNFFELQPILVQNLFQTASDFGKTGAIFIL
jgi:hypothetical protein